VALTHGTQMPRGEDLWVPLLPIVLGAWWDYATMARRARRYRQEAAADLRERERLTGSPPPMR